MVQARLRGGQFRRRTDFFRFPSVSLTQTTTQVGSYGTLDPTNLYDLAGKDPAGYGTPFDLQELAGVSPLLNVNDVTEVRIVDCVGDINPAYATYDSQGNIVNGPWPAYSSAGSEGFCLAGVGVLNPEPTWNVNGSGIWSAAGSWQNNIIPTNLLNTATFDAVPDQRHGPHQPGCQPYLERVDFQHHGANSYAIGTRHGSQLTLANSGSAVSLVVGGGSQSIGVPMTLDDNLAVNVAAGSSLLITGAVSGNKSLGLSGGGTLRLAGSNSYSGPTTVNTGTLQIGNGGEGATLSGPGVTLSRQRHVGLRPFRRDDL